MDVRELWDFDDAAGSEQRFRAARDEADAVTTAVLTTQVARALGLQGRYDEGFAELEAVPPEALEEPVVRVRSLLERGRLHRSSGDPVAAEPSFAAAAREAQQAGLGDLQLDALHMLAVLPEDPAEQVRRHRIALEVARDADDEGARRWVAPLLNNLGMALHESGDDESALAVFEEALEVRRAEGEPRATRVARWMVAWTMRLVGREEAALAEQVALAEEHERAGSADPFVHDELAELYAARGDEAAAVRHAELAARHRAEATPGQG